MRKHTTIDLDKDLLREAASALGTTRIIDTIHAALVDVVRGRQRLDILDVPTDLDLGGLDQLRAHRFAERPAEYRDDAD